jgi:methionyl-tRNA synthetase
MDKAKMSKSRGNVVDPVATMNDVYGVDGVRWYLMRVGGDLRTDADYGPDELVAQYRALSDTIGNLVGRISSPAILGKVDRWNPARDRHEGMDEALEGMKGAFKARMDEVDVSRACEGIMDVVQQVGPSINTSFGAGAGKLKLIRRRIA